MKKKFHTAYVAYSKELRQLYLQYFYLSEKSMQGE